MRVFACQACGQTLFFDNHHCEQCGRAVGFIPNSLVLTALDGGEASTWRAFGGGPALRSCANAQTGACNWLITGESTHDFCIACSHNRTVPDVSQIQNRLRWQKLESGKRHLFYSLIRFGLPLSGRPPLYFDFLADGSGEVPVLTGHDNGLITVALIEADDSEREKRRTTFGEPYRTIVGHFRHEVGHYYWNRLVAAEAGPLTEFRDIFGDERASYEDALQAYYSNGPRSDWPAHFVSAYASAHPWEDFAETWAHYFHVVDALDTAASLHLQVALPIGSADPRVSVEFDAYRAPSAAELVSPWVPLSMAINTINRSIGQPDLYPFVLAPPVIPKLQFIHDLIVSTRGT